MCSEYLFIFITFVYLFAITYGECRRICKARHVGKEENIRCLLHGLTNLHDSQDVGAINS